MQAGGDQLIRVKPESSRQGQRSDAGHLLRRRLGQKIAESLDDGRGQTAPVRIIIDDPRGVLGTGFADVF